MSIGAFGSGRLPGPVSNARQISKSEFVGRTTMKYAIRAILMMLIAAGAVAMSGKGLYAQGADPNAAPNPYKMLDSWAQLPADRKFGGVIKVQVDHSDGKSIWVFDRCGSNECTNSTLAPLHEVRCVGQVRAGDRRRPVRGFACALRRPRGQRLGRRSDRQERQGRRSDQVQPGRQGADDDRQARNAGQRSGLSESA